MGSTNLAAALMAGCDPDPPLPGSGRITNGGFRTSKPTRTTRPTRAAIRLRFLRGTRVSESVWELEVDGAIFPARGWGGNFYPGWEVAYLFKLTYINQLRHNKAILGLPVKSPARKFVLPRPRGQTRSRFGSLPKAPFLQR